MINIDFMELNIFTNDPLTWGVVDGPNKSCKHVEIAICIHCLVFIVLERNTVVVIIKFLQYILKRA
jgi:hypothetical protein